MGAEIHAGIERFGPRNINVGVDRQVEAGGEGGQSAEQCRCAALGAGRCNRPFNPVAVAAAGQAKGFDHGKGVGHTGGVQRVALEQIEHGGGDCFAPVGNGVEGGYVGHLQSEHHSYTQFVVGRQNGVDAGRIERKQRHHVLDGGDAGADAFGRAKQAAQPDLLNRAWRITARQGVEHPHFQRRGFEPSLEEHVV